MMMAFMVKLVFSIPLRGPQGFINSAFKFAQLSLLWSQY
ncbi:hypothetical protein BTN50_0871 [Candidatus Enterovibrio altilux]|uniref:Uncharacterized protein n=1 Tax=Candidatus Enterovibrio altilux TaxID=1927128 RepID=A0A291B8P6_9GAMM|nr:hypothetical protein BTN50_0871 [Candidatus Enterovibrio luxaltus]